MTPKAYVDLAFTDGGVDKICQQIRCHPLSVSQTDLCTFVEIDNANFVTLLQLLVIFRSGREALLILLEHNPLILTAQAVNHIYPIRERQEVHSPIAVLATSSLGREIIRVIITHNPKIIAESTLNHSTDVLNLSGGLTPAAILSCFGDGVEILTALAQEGIMMLSNTLISPVSLSTETGCVLHWLTTFPSGLELIKQMLYKRYESISAVELAVLNTISPPSANVVRELKSLVGKGTDDLMMPQVGIGPLFKLN